MLAWYSDQWWRITDVGMVSKSFLLCSYDWWVSDVWVRWDDIEDFKKNDID